MEPNISSINEMSIQQASAAITAKINEKLESLEKELVSVDASIVETGKAFRLAAAQGDFSENAAYQDAKDELSKLESHKYKLLNKIDMIHENSDKYSYTSNGEVGIFSTFRLKEESTSGEVTTWKVYPNALSDIETGVLSSECRVYRLLEGKKKDECIDVVDRVTGRVHKFRIIEVY